MKSTNIPAATMTQVTAALLHSSQSNHHSHCSLKRTSCCSCHVDKARQALAALEARQAEPAPA